MSNAKMYFLQKSTNRNKEFFTLRSTQFIPQVTCHFFLLVCVYEIH